MKTINIVKCTGLCNTYYEDENHLLKGKWGGFRDKNQHTQDGKNYIGYTTQIILSMFQSQRKGYFIINSLVRNMML